MKVKVMQVRSVGNYQTQTYSGTVEESSETALSFSVAGTIQQLKAQTGDHIQAGQLIATVNPATYKSSYKAAQATLEQAEDAYQRMKELYDSLTEENLSKVEVVNDGGLVCAILENKRLSKERTFEVIEGTENLKVKVTLENIDVRELQLNQVSANTDYLVMMSEMQM